MPTSGDLQDRISELSHKKAICKLRLNFLELDSISLKLGDTETNMVDRSKLRLTEDRIRSMKERLNGLEIALVSLRGTEESL